MTPWPNKDHFEQLMDAFCASRAREHMRQGGHDSHAMYMAAREEFYRRVIESWIKAEAIAVQPAEPAK